MKTKLLQCPFCGGTAEIVRRKRPNGPDVRARCTRCGKGDAYGWNRTLTATESWNHFAARAVFQSWDTLLWRNAEPAAAVIARLRDAIGT